MTDTCQLLLCKGEITKPTHRVTLAVAAVATLSLGSNVVAQHEHAEAKPGWYGDIARKSATVSENAILGRTRLLKFAALTSGYHMHSLKGNNVFPGNIVFPSREITYCRAIGYFLSRRRFANLAPSDPMWGKWSIPCLHAKFVLGA